MPVDLQEIVDGASHAALESVRESLNAHGGFARYLGRVDVKVTLSPRRGEPVISEHGIYRKEETDG